MVLVLAYQESGEDETYVYEVQPTVSGDGGVGYESSPTQDNRNQRPTDTHEPMLSSPSLEPSSTPTQIPTEEVTVEPIRSPTIANPTRTSTIQPRPVVTSTAIPRDNVEPVPGSAPSGGGSDSFSGTVSHYGESYNGGHLGCGFSPKESAYQDGRYHSDDPTIAATAWNRDTGRAYPCGTMLSVSGPGGTIRVQSVDACPGCRDPRYSAISDIDLSESGFQRVCGYSSGRCSVVYEVLGK